MSELKATPGPWQSRGGSADWWLGTDAGPILSASYLGCVEVENPADMPLIAAAPELYESLEWAMRFVAPVRAESPAPKGGGEDIAYREAQAALAKARGES